MSPAPSTSGSTLAPPWPTPPPVVTPSRMWRRRVLVGVCILLVAIGLLAAGRVVVVAATTPDRARLVRSQLSHLSSALDTGAAAEMQRLFPEGYLLTYALTALAYSSQATAGDQNAAATLRAWLAEIDSARGVAGMRGPTGLPTGAFHAGWSTLVAAELARVSGTASDVADARRRAAAILTATSAEPTGFVASYPGQLWPVDTVVALAAAARVDAVVGLERVTLADGASATRAEVVTRWLATTRDALDPATGLLPHAVATDGVVIDGVRGSSQAVIQVFWPDLVPSERAAEDWASYTSSFVVARAGLVGVLEYPANATQQPGDVDSGPLIMGVSLSAAAVTLAAALRHGDLELAKSLDKEAEIAGLPLGLGPRSYLFGTLPVGDAFLAWARSQQVPAAASPPAWDSPRPAWWAWTLVAALPAVLGGGVLLLMARTRTRHRPDPAATTGTAG